MVKYSMGDKSVEEREARIQAQEEEIRILKELVAALASEIVVLKAKIAELEARLSKNSRTSNKPPSTDGPGKGAIKNSRTPSGRRSGGQEGHPGTTRAIHPSPDTVIELRPKTQCDCGGQIILPTDQHTVRQVTDMQPVKVVTVEYRAHEGICEKCGKAHKANFPEGVNSPVSYGEHLQAMVTYLTNYQLIPLKRTSELMADLFGVKISEGVIVSAEQEVYEKLADAEECAKEELIQSDVAHYDETGMRVKGKTQWLHSAGTQSCTVYAIHEKRGTEAMDEIGILPAFRGTAIHDHWKSYYRYTQCAHGECNQHHLRSLKYLHEELGAAWADDMAGLLCRIKRHVELSQDFGADHLEQADIEAYERTYRAILASADLSKQAPVEARRMAKRLTEFEQETLLFMLDFDVPFTNNLAERDVRMPKAKQKISGCFRSDAGAKAFARTRGFISTVKKKGGNVFDGLVAAFRGDASVFLYPATHS
jgi:transposase